MKHPLSFLSQHARKPLFYFFFVFTLLLFFIFNQLDAPLRTSAAPNGIVSFELAGSANTSQQILDSWDSNARLAAAFGLGLDYLFMPTYALALSLWLLLAYQNKPPRYFFLSAWAGWGAFAAAAFDAVENYALWRVLTHSAFAPYAQIAALCAAMKFLLLAIGLVIALGGSAMKKI